MQEYFSCANIAKQTIQNRNCAMNILENKTKLPLLNRMWLHSPESKYKLHETEWIKQSRNNKRGKSSKNQTLVIILHFQNGENRCARWVWFSTIVIVNDCNNPLSIGTPNFVQLTKGFIIILPFHLITHSSSDWIWKRTKLKGISNYFDFDVSNTFFNVFIRIFHQ